MTAHERNLTVFEVQCSNGHNFESYNFSDFQYGERIIRTTDGRAFGLMTIDDNVVDEVGVIIEHVNKGSANENDPTAVFDHVFGLSCDPLEGRNLDASIRIVCPICHTSDVNYTMSNPPRTRAFTIPVVTHEKWLAMNLEQRRLMIEEALMAKRLL